ncbi:MAG: methionyl-tRNA formyltransferase [Melioribacter sp.]|nr:methionyl-tRNA formyltransferase [Melioribacter sp.]
MKIVFMGTPEFAIPSLQKLLSSSHSIEAVVSAPDKERGRGRQLSYTPVKLFALDRGIKVFTPANLKSQEFIDSMKEINPDLFVIVAFRILPKEVFTLPGYGSINLHGSLLPKYRGAAPIQWALINGDKETGVTTFFLDEKVDTGNIILQEKISIDDEDNFASLHDRMMIIGSDVVLKTVDMIEQGKTSVIQQNNSLSSPAPKITKEICQIDWNKPAIQIHNLVRGLSPYPSAFFNHNKKIIKVFKTKVIADENLFSENEWMDIDIHSTSEHKSSTKVMQTKKEIYFKTGNMILQIIELQPEGRKIMSAEEFLRGYKFPLTY